MGIYYALYLKMSILTYRYYKIDIIKYRNILLVVSHKCYNALKRERSLIIKGANIYQKCIKEVVMSVNQRLVNPLTDNLFDIILKLETREECYEFFEDLCTINELHDMSQRLEVARMLRHGEKYDKIEEATGASTATISRVKRSLAYGADGYAQMLKRIEKEKEDV